MNPQDKTTTLVWTQRKKIIIMQNGMKHSVCIISSYKTSKTWSLIKYSASLLYDQAQYWSEPVFPLCAPVCRLSRQGTSAKAKYTAWVTLGQLFRAITFLFISVAKTPLPYHRTSTSTTQRHQCKRFTHFSKLMLAFCLYSDIGKIKQNRKKPNQTKPSGSVDMTMHHMHQMKHT